MLREDFRYVIPFLPFARNRNLRAIFERLCHAECATDNGAMCHICDNNRKRNAKLWKRKHWPSVKIARNSITTKFLLIQPYFNLTIIRHSKYVVTLLWVLRTAPFLRDCVTISSKRKMCKSDQISFYHSVKSVFSIYFFPLSLPSVRKFNHKRINALHGAVNAIVSSVALCPIPS